MDESSSNRSELNAGLDYEEPIEIAEGIYWVGFFDHSAGLHCNPYVIRDGEDTVVIDAGSRPDFSTVMMKILQLGVERDHLSRLIFSHYDPDLCGCIPDLEAYVDNPELRIISHEANTMFIRHYETRGPIDSIDRLGYTYTMANGRVLEFQQIPYSHSEGSFMTYDRRTGTLFSGDLFGSYSRKWDLFLDFPNSCRLCEDASRCERQLPECPLRSIEEFHQRLFTSTRALRYAVDCSEKLAPERIAPQHGSVLTGPESVQFVSEKLRALPRIGIDAFLDGGAERA